MSSIGNRSTFPTFKAFVKTRDDETKEIELTECEIHLAPLGTTKYDNWQYGAARAAADSRGQRPQPAEGTTRLYEAKDGEVVPAMPPDIAMEWRPEQDGRQVTVGELRFPATLTRQGLFVQPGHFVPHAKDAPILGAAMGSAQGLSGENGVVDHAVQSSVRSTLDHKSVARADKSITPLDPPNNDRPANTYVDFDFVSPEPTITVARLDAKGNSVGDHFSVPHESWKTRFAPVIYTEGTAQGHLAAWQLRPKHFDGMNLLDWESFARRVADANTIRSTVRLEVEGQDRLVYKKVKKGKKIETVGAMERGPSLNHLANDVSTGSYIALLLYAAKDTEHLSSLIASRPSEIGRDLARVGHSAIFDTESLAEISYQVGRRYTQGISTSHVHEACATAHLVYFQLVGEFGKAKDANKTIKLDALIDNIKKSIGFTMNKHGNDLLTPVNAEAFGLALGFTIGGHLLFTDKQRSHGENRNDWITFGTNALFNLGLGIASGFGGGAGHVASVSAAALTTMTGSSSEKLIRKGVDKVFKIYDWNSGVSLFSTNLRAGMHQVAIASTSETAREAIESAINGINNAESWMKFFKETEGKVGDWSLIK